MSLCAIQPFSGATVIADEYFFSHLNRSYVSPAPLPSTVFRRALLFSEDFFHISYLLLNRASHLFGCAAVLQVNVSAGPTRLFFDRSLNLADASFYLILRTRFHAIESDALPRPDGVDQGSLSIFLLPIG